MGASPALTGTELTNLLGAGTVKRYLSPVPDVTVATALVNQTTFTYPLAGLTVDTTSGGWSSVREGMTVYIGRSAGLQDKGVYRVRKAGNSTTLYLEEITSQYPGQLALSIHATSIANNDSITVLQRYDLWSILPRINATTGLIQEDYDLAVGTHNTTPEDLTYITVNGIDNHLATYITTSTLAITASVSVVKWPTSSGSTLTYLWSYPAGWTGVSGSTTATLSATATPGNYVLRCTVTDSIGGNTERVIFVNIHDATTNPPLLISEMPRSDTRDRTSRRMSFSLYSNRLASLVDGAMCIYFESCTWNGVDVPTASRQFVGWIQRHEFGTADTLRESTVELVGPASILDKMQIVSNVYTATSPADTWQKVVPALSFTSFIAWSMLRWRVANVLRLFNFNVYSTTASGNRLPKWQVDKGSALAQIKQLITERGNFGSNSAGSFFLLYHPSLIAYGSRSGVVARDALTASIYKSLSVSRDLPPRVQQIRGEGLSWDGSAVLPTPYYSDAPKSPGQGSTQSKLGAQIVTGQSELNQLTGDYYALVNNPYGQFVIEIEKNRDVYEPAEMAFVAAILPASLSATGSSLSVNVIPLVVNKKHNADGTSDIELTAECETTGVTGDYVPVPVATDPTTPGVPPMTDTVPLPPLGDISIPTPGGVFPTVPGTGGPVVAPGKAGIRVDKTANKVYWSPDYTIAAPTEYDVTPTTFTNVEHATLDKGTAFSRRAYVLGNDGANSWIEYTTDIFQITPIYTSGATVAGVFNIVDSVRDIPGAVYIFGQGSGSPVSSNFLSGNGAGSWVEALFDPSAAGCLATTLGTYNGVNDRFEATYCATALGKIQRVTLNLGSPSIVNSVEVDTDFDSNAGGFYPSSIYYDGVFVAGATHAGGVGTDTLVYNVSTGGVTEIGIDSSAFTAPAGGHSYITAIRITYNLGITQSVYSTDYGVTLGTPRTVDTVTGNAGFDVGPRGIAALAGGDQRVRIALAGGTYANATNGGAAGSYPISVKVPTYKIGSTSLTNKAVDPDFLFQTPALVGGEAAWRKTIAGKVAVTPTVGGNKYLGVSPFGLDVWRGKRAIMIAEYSGTRYIFSTVNVGATTPVWSRTSHTNAVSVRSLLYSSAGKQWIAACGTDGLLYSNTAGVSWSAISVTGVSSYAELLG